MIVAAGILIIAPDPRNGHDTALMLLRGGGSDHPFEWSFPGGQQEPPESIEECAARETVEECGLAVDPSTLTESWTRSIAPAEPQPSSFLPDAPVVQSDDVDFTTFLHRVNAQFQPSMCDEHIAWCWAPVEHPPTPVHPGAMTALGRLKWNELDVARAMADGRLMSPVRYMNMWLWAIRITGTGAAYRIGLQEFVWREPEEWLTDEFLARCNGLQVIWVHPKNATLDSKEFAQRTIGSIFLPYIKGDEVWGIAKVYDDEAAHEMLDSQVSTSPTVVFGPESGSERLTTEEGQKLLIEGIPRLLDHVAICAAGVWDKGGDPVGVDRSAFLEPIADAQSSSRPVPSDILKARRICHNCGTTYSQKLPRCPNSRCASRYYKLETNAQIKAREQDEAAHDRALRVLRADALTVPDEHNLRGRTLRLRARSLRI
jgi:8-oxo-dGTP pyrophosphatase MutT (NUDIX family)